LVAVLTVGTVVGVEAVQQGLDSVLMNLVCCGKWILGVKMAG
jgi:hypothetical protein